MNERAAQKIFGVIAIVAGIVVIGLALAGVTLGPIVMTLIGLVVAGWLVYYFTRVRPGSRRQV